MNEGEMPLNHGDLRLLFITQNFPSPSKSGDRLIAFHLIRVLSSQHRIILLSIDDGSIEQTDESLIQQFCQSVKTVPILPASHRWLSYLENLPSKYPFMYRQTRAAKMADLIDKIVKRHQIDLVHFVGLGVVQYQNAVAGLPKVATLVDCASLRQYDFFRYIRNPFWKFHHFVNWQKLVKYEREFCREMDVCVMVASQDAEALKQSAYIENVRVISNGIQRHTRLNSPSKRDPYSLVFTGVMNYLPNVDAVIYFVQSILPQLLAKHPLIQFNIFGRSPTQSVINLAKKNRSVVVHGFAEDIMEEIEKNAVFVAPMRLGRGIKNKVLEAMAAGIPVVGTSSAFCGLSVIPGQDVLVADTPHSFVEKICVVLGDDKLRETLAQNGQRYVTEHHSWERIADQYLSLYDEVLGTHAG